MGDGGSYFLGSFIALYSIDLYNLNFFEKDFSINLFFLFLILFVPIVDMVYVVFSRVLKGKLPFLPDRRHLHHRLLRSGLGHKDSVVFCYLMSFFFTSISLGYLYPKYRFMILFSSIFFNICFIKKHQIIFKKAIRNLLSLK